LSLVRYFSHPWKNPLIRLAESLRFRFVLFQTVGSFYKFLTAGTTTALPTQNVKVIKPAAQTYVEGHLKSNAEVDMRVWEVRSVSASVLTTSDLCSHGNPSASVTG